jgi:tryptophan 2,3-dioxygenase
MLLAIIPQFDVLALMTPAQFLAFRDRLAPASGFGSCQLREIELLLGLKEIHEKRLRPEAGVPSALDGTSLPDGLLRPTESTPKAQALLAFYRHHPDWEWERLTRRDREPSLRDLVYGLLNGNALHWASRQKADADIDEFAVKVVREVLGRFAASEVVDEDIAADHIDQLGEVLSHRETIVATRMAAMASPSSDQIALAEFMAACVALDEALLRWRDRHIRFVESMIGRRPGTGGGGVAYLRHTVASDRPPHTTHAFPCLWQSRSLLFID